MFLIILPLPLMGMVPQEKKGKGFSWIRQDKLK